MPMNKSEFVRLLGVMLMFAGEEVHECFIDEEGTHVYIVFKNGFIKKVNIECDSHLAIIMDVTKALL